MPTGHVRGRGSGDVSVGCASRNRDLNVGIWTAPPTYIGLLVGGETPTTCRSGWCLAVENSPAEPDQKFRFPQRAHQGVQTPDGRGRQVQRYRPFWGRYKPPSIVAG